MAEAESFTPVKLVCGLIFSSGGIFDLAKEHLVLDHGPIDDESEDFDFDLTDYYRRQMGSPLFRRFLSFEILIDPERLSGIKLRTNELEDSIRRRLGETRRVVNIDPGILRASALIMATAKDFSHRIPLREGIYGHLEILFGRDRIRTLEWTYPDFKADRYHGWLLNVRRKYLRQLRALSA
jgi:hypothetical protein